MTYKATDSHGAATSKTFTIAVSAPASQPPIYNGGIGTIWFNAGASNSWRIPATAFTNPTGRALSYSITKSDGTALPTIYQFNATTGTLTATIPGRRGDMDTGVIITATDTTDHLSTHVSTDIYVTGNLGTNALPAGGTLDTVAQQTVPAMLPSLANASAGYGDNGSGQALLTLQSQVAHWDPDVSRGISGYDAEGHAQIYAYSAYNTTQQWHTTTYQVSYLEQNG